MTFRRPTKVDVFTSSGIWTKPLGAVSVRVLCIGPGGGGGGASYNGNVSGTGGNGGSGICVITTYF